jgi:hypothetical protein
VTETRDEMSTKLLQKQNNNNFIPEHWSIPHHLKGHTLAKEPIKAQLMITNVQHNALSWFGIIVGD